MLANRHHLFHTPASVQNETSLESFLYDCIREVENHNQTVVRIHISTSTPISLKYPFCSIIPQAPCQGNFANIEILAVEKKTDIHISHIEKERSFAVLLKKENYEELWSSGLYGEGKNIFECSKNAFEKVRSLLEKTHFCFDDIFRQWNYIGHILEEKEHENKCWQNYQVFNEIRAQYYNLYKRKKDYPAATGIGMNSNGVIIELLAVKNVDSNLSVQSPIQTDAHAYDQKFLIGESLHEGAKKTPLFERARAIEIFKEKDILVSGTASIKGQETLDSEDILKQMLNTLCFIDRLCPSNVLPQRLRVYIKPGFYLTDIATIIEKHYPDCPLNIIYADVCRTDLLIEIEADFRII